MIVEVLEKFKDKYTGEIRDIGATFEVDDKRRIELGKYVKQVEAAEPEAPEEPEAEVEAEKPKTESKTKNRKKKGKV